MTRHQKYQIVKNLKQNALPRDNIVLFVQEYGNNLGYAYFI